MKYVSLANRHEKAVTGLQAVGLSARRHLQRPLEHPDILHHAAACRVRRKADTRTGRKLDLDNVDV